MSRHWWLLGLLALVALAGCDDEDDDNRELSDLPFRVEGANGIEIRNHAFVPNPMDGTYLGDLDTTNQRSVATFQVVHTGSGDLAFPAEEPVTILGGDSDAFTVTGQLPSAIGDSNSGTSIGRFEITFDPAEARTYRALVTIVLDDEDNDVFSFLIAGDGRAGELVLRDQAGNALGPGATLDFGSTGLEDDPVDRLLVLENEGNDDLVFAADALRLSGADRADFTIEGAPAPGTRLRPGEQAVVNLAFVASESGRRTTTLTVTAGGEGRNYNLRGEGLAAQVAVVDQGTGQAVTNNGTVLVSRLRGLSLQIQNTPGAAGNLVFTRAPELTGVDAAYFTLAAPIPEVGDSLAPGTAQLLQVTYDPRNDTATPHRAQLLLFTNDPATDEMVINLEGYEVLSPEANN